MMCMYEILKAGSCHTGQQIWVQVLDYVTSRDQWLIDLLLVVLVLDINLALYDKNIHWCFFIDTIR